MLIFDWVAWRANGLVNCRINFRYVSLWLLGPESHSWRAAETIVRCWVMIPATWRARETIMLFQVLMKWPGGVASWAFGETVVALCNVKKVPIVFADLFLWFIYLCDRSFVFWVGSYRFSPLTSGGAISSVSQFRIWFGAWDQKVVGFP